VVADNRFSALGVVLLATLARLSKVTGISQELKAQPRAIKPKETQFVAKEDLGERVSRVDDAPPVKPVKISRSESGPEPLENDSKRARPKKSKKKKNAIDDLFNGLF
jgi:ribonuclease MRP protein subunit RMP1